MRELLMKQHKEEEIKLYQHKVIGNFFLMGLIHETSLVHSFSILKAGNTIYNSFFYCHYSEESDSKLKLA